MQNEKDNVIGHPTEHDEVGDRHVEDVGQEVEIDDKEYAEADDQVQDLSAEDVGGDYLDLPSLDAGNNQWRDRDVEDGEEELD